MLRNKILIDEQKQSLAKHQSSYWKMHRDYTMKIEANMLNYNLSAPISTLKQYNADLKLPQNYSWHVYGNNIESLNDNCDIIQLCDFLTSQHLFDHTSYNLNMTPDLFYWHIGGKHSKNVIIVVKLNDVDICGMIAFSIGTYQICESITEMVSPRLLVVKHEYKKTGLAQLLMDKMIGVSQECGFPQYGIFSTNKLVPRPVVRMRYYYRPLNYKYLVESNFINNDDDDLDTCHIKMKIKLKPYDKMRIAEKSDTNVNFVLSKFNTQLCAYNVHPIYTKNDIEELFFGKDCVVVLIYNDDDDPVDFVMYRVFNLNSVECPTTEIKCAFIMAYSTSTIVIDVMMMHLLKQISFDGCHIVFVSDLMENSDVVLSSSRTALEDTDNEDCNTIHDMFFMKWGRQTFLNLYNWQCPTNFKPNMVFWLTPLIC